MRPLLLPPTLRDSGPRPSSLLAQILPLLVYLAPLLFPPLGQAEFLKTGDGVFQSTALRAKVIVSEREPGIFIAYPNPIDIQVFDPAALPADTTLHAFIRFDHARNRYTELLVGKSSYRINGSFSLALGDLKISVDNANPYLSIVLDDSSSAQPSPSIIGFLGISPVVNFSRQEAVALLEANQFSEYKGVIEPYIVTMNGLKVKGQALTSGVVGVPIEIKNSCLAADTLVIDRAEIDQVRNAKSQEESKRLLAQAIKAARGNHSIDKLLKLKSTKNSIIAFDPDSNSIKVVKEVREISGAAHLCVADEVKF